MIFLGLQAFVSRNSVLAFARCLRGLRCHAGEGGAVVEIDQLAVRVAKIGYTSYTDNRGANAWGHREGSEEQRTSLGSL